MFIAIYQRNTNEIYSLSVNPRSNVMEITILLILEYNT